jgi:excisionase family DNA binding protein
MARNEERSPQQLEFSIDSRYLNIEQVAAILGVPKSFIYRRTARGHGDPIPHYRIGSHLRFKPDDIQEWIEGHRHEPEAESPAALVAALRQTASRSTSPQKPARRYGRSS